MRKGINESGRRRKHFDVNIKDEENEHTGELNMAEAEGSEMAQSSCQSQRQPAASSFKPAGSEAEVGNTVAEKVEHMNEFNKKYEAEINGIEAEKNEDSA
eukprot:14535297-Alexandrium_andersonii.AAC.1